MRAIRAALKNERNALMALLLVGLLVRVLVLLTYQTIELADSQAYRVAAEQIRLNDFREYTGLRTPGYPLFILACFRSAGLIWIAQSLLGVLTSVGVFRLVLNRVQRVLPAFVAGLIASLCLHMLLFEAMVMTETLSAFILVWSLVLLQGMVTAPTVRMSRAVGLGLLLAIGVMVRPGLLFLVPIYLAVLLVRPGGWANRIRRAGGYLLPIVLIIGGWSAFNWVKADYLGPSTLTGIQLCTHNIDFIDAAPDEFADIRDAVMQHWPAEERRSGKQRNGIWEVFPAVRQRSGETYGALSRRMTRMHLVLVKRCPGQYLSQIYVAWNQFWLPHRDYIKLNLFRPRPVGMLMEILVTEERRWLSAINALFVLGSGVVCGLMALRRRLPHVFDLTVVLVVSAAAIFHAITSGNDNSRYAVPFIPLIFYSVTIWVWQLFARTNLTRAVTIAKDTSR